MHELSIAEAIAEKVQQRAAGRHVGVVVIRVGHLRQVVPDALQFCWSMVTDATGLAGCRLEIEEMPATVHCAACDADTTLDQPIMLCRSCGSADLTVRTGEELVVVSLELVEV